MALSFDSLPALLSHGYDTVIDVRSPAEFAEDHLPGAISLPALSNEERARVGTIYKQESPFRARKLGAALVARNVAAHLEGPLKDKEGAWRPLVYCWRGGQRSGSVATILREVGWRAETVQGGYQSYRRLVHGMLYDNPLPHRLILLDGNTGTAKTEVLARLPAHGVQSLDLEGLANHRGSLLGPRAGGQPAQRGFESALALALSQLDPARPTVVEAESSKIGAINLPPSLWAAMMDAPRIEVTAPLEARAAYLSRAYADLTAEPEELRARLQPLRQLRGHEVVDGWEALLKAGDHRALAAALMQQHYDPAYSRSRAAKAGAPVHGVTAEVLDEAGLTDLTARVAAGVAGIAAEAI